MEIQWKNYFIKVEENQFTLYVVKTYEKGNNIGETYTQDVGYFSKLENALQKMVRLETMNKNEVMPLKDYILWWKEVSSQLLSDIRHELMVAKA